jgi:hypothetical protein
MLANIVGAQRPTTTISIHSLIDQGRLLRDGHHYVLLGDPPDWRQIDTSPSHLDVNGATASL